MFFKVKRKLKKVIKGFISNIQGIVTQNTKTLTSDSVQDWFIGDPSAAKSAYNERWLSESLTPVQLEDIYKLMITTEFYDKNYGTDWHSTPYEKMADIIIDIFKPEKTMNIGCGIGFLEKALNKKGVDGQGIEFSKDIYGKIDKKLKSKIKNISIEDFYNNFSFVEYDLVISMEVFEHLPPSIIKENLLKLKKEFIGNIFLTIPMFGYDQVFKNLGINDLNPEWAEDISKNKLFSNIVLYNGKPDCGHITLASYNWWSDFFYYHGFVRNFDLEKELYNKHKDTLKRYSWKPMILKKIDKNIICKGADWHQIENINSNKCRWSKFNSDLYFETDYSYFSINFKFSLPEKPSANHYMQYSLFELLFNEIDYSFSYVLIDSGTKIFKSTNDIIETAIDFRPNKMNSGKYKLIFNTPILNPDDLSISKDSRNLGYCFEDIMELRALSS